MPATTTARPFASLRVTAAPGLPAVRVRERGFVPTELTLLFRMAGLEVPRIWGGTAGSWNRGPIQLDEFEIMIVGQKVRRTES
jgi:hypothetical protein